MILITGSTGLLGGHLLYALLQTHDRVAALKRSTASTRTLREIFSYYTKDPDELMSRIDWRTGDLLDKESLVAALEGITCVINCAAIVSFDPRDHKKMIANNVTGVQNLIDALLLPTADANMRPYTVILPTAHCLLIHISSTSALGDSRTDNPKFLIDEETPRDSNKKHTGYSESKYLSERVVMESGIPAVILNPGIILGPGQWDKGSSQLFARAWKRMKYYPYGGTGYVDVRDIAAIMIKIIDQVGGSSASGVALIPPQRYCLVGSNLRYREFFNLVTDEYGKPNPSLYAGKILTGIAWRADTLRARLLGKKPALTRETAASAQRISYFSAEKVKKALGFEFKPIEETIEWVADCWKRDMKQP